MSSEQKLSTKVELFTWCVKKMFEKKLWTEILNSSCEQKMWIVVGVFVVVVVVVVVVVIVVVDPRNRAFKFGQNWVGNSW